MTSSDSYRGRFKDPRWQKKRLQIMARAEFKCEWCGSKKYTLHIHHGYYAKYSWNEPWNYPDNTLYCLCKYCHSWIEDRKHDVHLEVARVHPRYYEQLLHYILDFKELTKEGKIPAEENEWEALEDAIGPLGEP